MSSTQHLSITLSDEMASNVRAKVASGEYASESDVIQEALRTVYSHEQSLEDWLRHQVAASYDALRANPETGIPLEEVRTRLAGRTKAPRT